MSESSSPLSPSANLFWLTLLLTSAAVTAVSSNSFWIDEFATTHFASQKSLADCWGEMVHLRFPELQAPLYMAYIWSWVHAFGTGEWTMRFAGVPWFVGGAIAFTTILGRTLRATSTVAVIVGFSSFAWYYLNEARLYSFQLGFALAAVAAAFELARTPNPSPSAVRLFAFAFVGLCGSNVLGAFAGFFLFVALVCVVPAKRWLPTLKAAPMACVLGTFFLAGLAAYYGWTLTVQTRPTAVSTTTWHSLAFALYEIFGAIGYGPARHDLREQGIGALRPFLAPFLVFTALCSLVVSLGIFHAEKTVGRRRLAIGVAAALLPFVLLAIVGVSTQFRMVGRHVTAIAPLALLLLATGTVSALRAPGWRRVLAASFLVLWVISALSTRFAPWHRKDEYRGAMEFARAAAETGKTVWWNADLGGLAYYGNPSANPILARHVVPLANPLPTDLPNLPPPLLIVISKSDTYDRFGAVSTFVRDQGFTKAATLPAFSFWVPASARDLPLLEKR